MADTDTIPDRVCIEQWSPHYFEDYKHIGVKINDKPINNCYEFCISEGWVKLLLKDSRGNYKRERGRLLWIMHKGMKVEPYWRDTP